MLAVTFLKEVYGRRLRLIISDVSECATRNSANNYSSTSHSLQTDGLPRHGPHREYFLLY
jgi:hypothetical protein